MLHGITVDVHPSMVDAFHSTARHTPPGDMLSRTSPLNSLSTSVDYVRSLLSRDDQTGVVPEVVCLLRSLAKQSDRGAVVESVAQSKFHALQYVDDTIVPCGSQGDVVAVVNKTPSSACSRYALRTKSRFHYAVSKTCSMAILHSPELVAEGLDCEVVQQKLLLGVLVDAQLTFDPSLDVTLARGWSSFVSFLQVGRSGGLSLPVLATQTETRVVSKMLHLAPFLFLAQGAFHKLNRLQWRWGKMLLGVADSNAIRQPMVCAQCGWKYRLGTTLAIEVVMTLARLEFLRRDHPLRILHQTLAASTAHTWWDKAKDWLSGLVLPWPCPSILECGMFTRLDIEEAQGDSQLRQRLLKRYRQDIVLPLFTEFDRIHFFVAASRPLEGFGWSPLQLNLMPVDWASLIHCDFFQETYSAAYVQCWALVRSSARWPLPLFGLPNSFPLYHTCRCGEADATVKHVLCHCPCTAWCSLAVHFCDSLAPGRQEPAMFLRFLFDPPLEGRRFEVVASYVFYCFQCVC